VAPQAARFLRRVAKIGDEFSAGQHPANHLALHADAAARERSAAPGNPAGALRGDTLPLRLHVAAAPSADRRRPSPGFVPALLPPSHPPQSMCPRHPSSAIAASGLPSCRAIAPRPKMQTRPAEPAGPGPSVMCSAPDVKRLVESANGSQSLPSGLSSEVSVSSTASLQLCSSVRWGSDSRSSSFLAKSECWRQAGDTLRWLPIRCAFNSSLCVPFHGQFLPMRLPRRVNRSETGARWVISVL